WRRGRSPSTSEPVAATTGFRYELQRVRLEWTTTGSMPLSLDAYLSHLRADGAAMAAAAGRDLTARVPGCPEWTTTDLLQHLGQVHRWTEQIVRTNADRPMSRSATPPPPEGAELVEWFATGVELLASTFE